MARVDDFVAARKLSIETLKEKPIDDILHRSGFNSDDDTSIRIPFLDRVYRVDYPGFEFCDMGNDSAEIQIQEQVLILHYLIGVDPSELTGEWIPYREIPGAALYHGVFLKRAADPLKNVFGSNPSGFIKVASMLDGKSIDFGDVAFEFSIFPKVPIRLILWEGDDDFPPEANILFDKSISFFLSPEDIAWLAGLPVYRMIALHHRTSS